MSKIIIHLVLHSVIFLGCPLTLVYSWYLSICSSHLFTTQTYYLDLSLVLNLFNHIFPLHRFLYCLSLVLHLLNYRSNTLLIIILLTNCPTMPVPAARSRIRASLLSWRSDSSSSAAMCFL